MPDRSCSSRIGRTYQRNARRTCADSLRRILDHNQPMPRSKCHDARHVSRLAIKMDGNDRLHCTVKTRFGVGKVDIRALLLDVAENGRCSDIKHPPGGSDESIGWDQHLVPWADAGGDQGKMQSRRTRVDADRVGDTEIVGRRLLKAFDERAEAERALLRTDGGYRAGPWLRFAATERRDQ